MLETLTWLGIFAISLSVLIKASDIFTEQAETIGKFFGLPSFIIGVIIVGVGTSLPELMSSISAVLQGSSEHVFGNVIGSNIANIFLILGITAVFGKEVKLEYDISKIDLPLFLGTALLVSLMLFHDDFSLGESFLCLIAYGIYLIYTTQQGQTDESDSLLDNDPTANPNADSAENLADDLAANRRNLQPSLNAQTKTFPVRSVLLLIVSLVLIFFSADYTVRAVVKLSELLNINPELIAVSVLALGTSLPEFTVSIICACKGKPDVAVGNILGSNVFNILVVMAIPRWFGELKLPENLFNSGLLEMLGASLLLCIVVQDQQITKWEGCLFIVFYVWFVGEIFGLF